MPDAAPPVNRYRRNSSRSNSDSAVLAIISNLSTLHQWFPCGPLLACHLTWSLPGLFLLRSRPWLFTTAARGGLKPAPASRFRGARPHQLSSYALRQPALPSCSWHTTVKLTGIHSFSTRTQFFPARNTSGLAGMSISGTSRKSVNLTVPCFRNRFSSSTSWSKWLHFPIGNGQDGGVHRVHARRVGEETLFHPVALLWAVPPPARSAGSCPLHSRSPSAAPALQSRPAPRPRAGLSR